MGAKTAGDIINDARNLSGQWDLGKIPDGWDADIGEYPKGATALSFLRLRLRDLSRTGYNQCQISIPTVADQDYYLFTRRAGTIRRAVVVDNSDTDLEFPLVQTSLEALDRQFYGWKRARAIRPTHYYFVGSKMLGIYPISNNADFTMKFLADTQVAVPTAPTDIIGQLYNADGIEILDEDLLGASSLGEMYYDTLAQGVAADMARSARDWALYGSLEKQWRTGVEHLKMEVQTRQAPVNTKFMLNINGRGSRGLWRIGF